MNARLYAVLVALPIAGLQGGELWARSSGHGHGRYSAVRSTPSVVVPRVVVRPTAVVSRIVYYVPAVVYATPRYYAPVPYYPPVAPAYTYAQPPTTSYYSEPSQVYSPPPVGSAAPEQAPASSPAPTGPYAVEQAINYRFFCPDVRLYYPEIKECPAGWLTVLPGNRKPPG